MRARDENKENAIREKAIQMIVESGFDGLSMQKLAKAAGVSPATIYIYFKDRDDLIEKIAIEESNNMTKATLQGFSPQMPFSEGLWIQWKNRAAYWMKNPVRAKFMEQVRYSPVGLKLQANIKKDFIAIMREFAKNSLDRGDLAAVSPEIYWSLAYSPLYQLIKYHHDGRGLNNEPFVLTETIMKNTFDRVIRSLTP